MAKVLFMRSPRSGMARDQCRKWSARIDLWMILAAVAIATLLIVIATEAHAQTYQVIHNFTGGGDGGYPSATLTLDRAGNLYGTTSDGTVFKLAHAGSGWILTPLYSFQGGYDGHTPDSPVTFGPDGNLYGTTAGGGYNQGAYCDEGGCGVVYRVGPPATAPPSVLTPWRETVLHAFVGPPTDGDQPAYGALTFDHAGNLYGTAEFGGTGGFGIVYELTPSGGDWTESVLYNFSFGSSGEQPESGIVMDSAGNIYGTASEGGFNGNGDGVVYELSPSQNGWLETILHTFGGGSDGGLVYAGLVMDQAGNLYGATYVGGVNNGGLVYELSPSSGGWTYQVLYSFSGSNGSGPVESLTLDAAGNLYGATFGDGLEDAGMVFKLSQSNGAWTLTDLHNFAFDVAWFPYGGVTLDANGNLYGTASNGGAYGHGIVWEITP